MNKWISVKDGLPENESIVWIPDKKDIDTGFVINGGWFTPYMFSAKVTHWMEFPAQEEWNNVKDGLPEELGWYFTFVPIKGERPIIWKTLYTGYDFIAWDNIDVWSLMDRGITHWIPLPDQPEED